MMTVEGLIRVLQEMPIQGARVCMVATRVIERRGPYAVIGLGQETGEADECYALEVDEVRHMGPYVLISCG